MENQIKDSKWENIMALKEKNILDEKDFEVKFTEFKTAFGKRVKYFRDLKNYTQEHLAELVNIEQASLSNIERGKVYPTQITLYRLAAVLEVEPYRFFTVSPKLAVQDMVKEIANAMYQDENLAELMYKFFCAVH